MRHVLLSEDGVVTAMVAILALALLTCAALAFDGGALVSSVTSARGTAAAAARAGAQELSLTALHDGRAQLDPDRATAAAVTLLDAAGVRGSVTVDGASVTVTVHERHEMRLLPVPDRDIDATAPATAVSDVLGGTP